MGDFSGSSDARVVYSGTYGGWLSKFKGDGAKIKWFSDSGKRFFTIDYESQTLSYSHSEDRKKNSQLIRFREILGAELRVADGWRSFFPFVLNTPEREYVLWAADRNDAMKWVQGLNAAKDIANGKKPSSQQGSMSSASTSVDSGSESGRSTPTHAQNEGSSSSSQHGPGGGFQQLAQSQDPQHHLVHRKQQHDSSAAGSQQVAAQSSTKVDSGSAGSGSTPPCGEDSDLIHPKQQHDSSAAGSQQVAAQSSTTVDSGLEGSGSTPSCGGGSGPKRHGPIGEHSLSGDHQQKQHHQSSTQKAGIPPSGQPQPGPDRHTPCEQHESLAERRQNATPAVQKQTQDVDPFAALDALEELAGPATVSYCSAERMQADARNERDREAQRAAMVTKCKPRSDEPPIGVTAQPTAPTQASAVAPSRVLAEVGPPKPSAGPPQKSMSDLPKAPAQVPQAPTPQGTERISINREKVVVSDEKVVEAFDQANDELPPRSALPAAPTQAPAAPRALPQVAPPKPSVGAPRKHLGALPKGPARLPQAPAPPTALPSRSASAQPAPVVHTSADDSWDSDDGAGAGTQKSLPRAPLPKADACGAPRQDACGAPARSGHTFVVARPSQAAAPAPRQTGSDLDDLVNELEGVTAEAVNLDGLVPNFHCTQCDQQVMRVFNSMWTDDVDYMFCRNFYPNPKKLRRNLVKRKGCSAFCCQCSWKSADSSAALTDVAEGLRWKQLG